MESHALASLRPRRAAETLGISLSTFWRLAKRPDFPKLIKLGARITLVDRGQLLAFRDAQAKR